MPSASRDTSSTSRFVRAHERTRGRVRAACATALALLVAVGMAHPAVATASPEIPVGTVAPAGSSVPAGWLLADGSAVSRSTYSELFAVVGTTYGPGDGSTTFNLPNLRQRFALGQSTAGTGSALASTGGTIDHTHVTASHLHSVAADGAHTHAFPGHVHSFPRHRHTGFSNVSMTAGGEHRHTAASGRHFVVAGANILWQMTGGTIAIGLQGATASAGNHDHSYSGNVGPGAVDGDFAFDSTGTSPTGLSDAVGTHAHGNTGSTSFTSGSSNPAFQSVEYIIKASSTAGSPCGAIWGTARATPSPGALLANGSAQSRTGEGTLFGCLGTSFGAGDGSTTFNLPNLAGRFPLGRATAGTGSVLGSTGGSLDHTHSTGHAHSVATAGAHTVTLPTHSHQIPGHGHSASLTTTTDGSHNHNPSNGGNFVNTDGGYSRGGGGSRNYDTPADTSWAGSHDHVVTADSGNTSGPDGSSAFWSTSTSVTSGTAQGGHNHGATTNGTTGATSGGSNPAFQTINYELQTGAGYTPAIGTVTPYAGTATPPAGWRVADGAALSRSAYPDLFAAIGTTYGSGDGSTTFNVPDLRGRIALGKAAAGTGSTLGATGGSLDHSHDATHGHTTSTDGAHAHTGLGHDHYMPGHHHSFSRTFANAGNHQHNATGTGNFWGEHISGGANNVQDASGGGTRDMSHPQYTDYAWGSHKHGDISGSVGPGAASSGNASLLGGTTDPGSDTVGAHTHTVNDASVTTGAANAPFLTLRYIIKVSDPSIVDNQTGDTTWRNSNSGTYNVDFVDPSGQLASFSTNVWSAAGQGGVQRQAWTQVAAISGSSYATNWSLLASTWTAMAQGTNYVSVRVTNGPQTATSVDTFTVNKDTVDPPSVTTLAATTPTTTAPALTWSTVTDATSGVAYYRVYRGTSSTGPWTQVSTNGSPTTGAFTDSAATVNATHWYRVQAVDRAGNEASTSNVISVLYSPTITLAVSTLGHGDSARDTTTPFDLGFGLLSPNTVREIGPVGSGQVLAGPAVRLSITSNIMTQVEGQGSEWTNSVTGTTLPVGQLAFKSHGVTEAWTPLSTTATVSDATLPAGSPVVEHDLRLTMPSNALAGTYTSSMTYAVVASP